MNASYLKYLCISNDAVCYTTIYWHVARSMYLFTTQFYLIWSFQIFHNIKIEENIKLT